MKKYILILLLALAVLIYLFFVFTPSDDALTDRHNPDALVTLDGDPIAPEVYEENKTRMREVSLAVEAGDFSTAAQLAEAILDDEEMVATLNAKQLYQARRNMLFKYRATGDPADSLDAVEEIKKTIFDERMPMERRGEALTTLANSVCWFARDPIVEDAIFSGPFSQYRHEDINLANRDMLLLSFNEYGQTAKTAASLAYWYADVVITNDLIEETLDPALRTEYIAQAKRFIEEADRLSSEEMEHDDRYIYGASFIGYLYRRAFAIGALAAVGELSYEEYEAAYELFHTYAKNRTTTLALQMTPFAHVLQAQFEKVHGIKADIVVQNHLRDALSAIAEDPNPQSNEITDFVKDKAELPSLRYSWYAIQNMRSELPEFDAYITEIENEAKGA